MNVNNNQQALQKLRNHQAKMPDKSETIAKNVKNSIFEKNTTTYSGTVSHDEYQDGVQVAHYDIPFSGNVDVKFNTTDEKNTTTYSGTVSHDEYQDGVQVAHYDIPFSGTVDIKNTD